VTAAAIEVDLPGFRFRELAPADGPAIASLFDASPDTGLIRFRPAFQVDPYVALTYDGRQTGVVVERDDHDGIVGLGLIEIGDVVIRGRPTPYALLHSLVVHPDVRRRGVARAIVAWRLARATETLGEDAVVIATIQKSNAGSFAAAASWARQLTDPIWSVAIGLRSAAPRPPAAGLTVRPARDGDLEAFATGYTAGHDGFELWSPVDASELARWRTRSPIEGVRINELWVVEDANHELLAGLGTSEVRRTSLLRVDAMPAPMRVLNAFVRVVPSGGVLEQVRYSRMWFRPGAETSARFLFETLRWEVRDQGNVVIASFDPRGPLRRMAAAPRWLPKAQLSLAIRAPEQLRPDRPIEPVQ